MKRKVDLHAVCWLMNSLYFLSYQDATEFLNKRLLPVLPKIDYKIIRCTFEAVSEENVVSASTTDNGEE